MSYGQLFILSAPSGTGKTTVLKKVMADLEGLAFSVSHTTREPREGEKNGIDYHFIGRQQFLRLQEQGDFLEFAEVHGNLYGTSRSAVIKQIGLGLDVILDIDVQGARIVRNAGELEAIYVFFAPPGLIELEKRLRKRGQDSEETMRTRLMNARKEMSAMMEYQYLVVNDEVEKAVRMFEAIILAERSKGRRSFSGTKLSLDEMGA